MSLLALIFANTADACAPELTRARAMASVPFGGRYHMIDFTLSAMINAGITTIGIATRDHYLPLSEHLGSGRDWDLHRRDGGLVLLPPNCGENTQTRLQALSGSLPFLQSRNEEHIILADSNIITAIDISEMFTTHQKTGADITTTYAQTEYTEDACGQNVIIDMDAQSRVTALGCYGRRLGRHNLGLNIWLMKREYLIHLINHAIARGHTSFTRQALAPRLGEIRVFGYSYNGYCARISSLCSYYRAHMELLNAENRRALLQAEGKPVYTRVRNSPATKYTAGAVAGNSLIADGCVIEGEVQGSVLFRGVRVGRGAVVRNSVIMPHSYIAPDAALECVVADRGVVAREGARLCGREDYPFYIAQGAMV
ncbi:MAG: glucose-1-phosphate adenylyltransferase subunit GlgD [Clostridia bacterium]|nr:glucose-1-phosphate adenylyltransferase subunit GlgD [Clostridia bacterium]